jgi:glutamate racemase
LKIGVFDSGLGGEIVTERLRKIFPDEVFTVVNDRDNLPYGGKTRDEIVSLTEAAIQSLIKSADVIIIACNTATAAAIGTLRSKYPNTPFIGFEPAIKPAGKNSEVDQIMVLATPFTLSSEKYRALKKRYCKGINVIEPDCSKWAEKIENGMFTDEDLEIVVREARNRNVDEIVLGCTHYLAIEENLRRVLPNVRIETPILGVANRLKEIMLKY